MAETQIVQWLDLSLALFDCRSFKTCRERFMQTKLANRENMAKKSK